MNRSKIVIALVLCGISAAAWAKVVPARVFSDGMVLQREMKVPVWGKAAPGEKVTVEFAGQKLETTACKAGKWRVNLAPLKTESEGQIMKISGSDEAVEIKDVLVGEVWLCGGQSNMYQPIWGKNPRYRQYNGLEIAKNANFPKIRFIKMPLKWSLTPDRELIKGYKWQAITPESILPSSAVAYFFGRELFTKLNVPVGLIQSSWGGSRIDPWSAPEGFRQVPQAAQLSYEADVRTPGTKLHKQVADKFQKEMKSWLPRAEKAIAAGKLPPPPPEYPAAYRAYPRPNTTPSSLYNVMILPFVPYAMRGAIWYQGCANLTNGYDYVWRLEALHKGWATVFENPDFKLYIAQLAPYIYGDKKVKRVKSTKPVDRLRAEMLPKLQFSQQIYADSTPKAGLAVITDVGNLDDIHPGDKTKVGLRLANLALKYDYGMKDIKAESPRVIKRRAEGNRMILSFKDVEKWVCKDGKAPVQFEISGAAGAFHPAVAEIKGTDIVVYSDKVSDPQRVNYAWSHFFEAELFNEAGLPLGPFAVDLLDIDQKIENYKKRGRMVYAYQLIKSGQKGAVTLADNSKNAGEFSRVNYLLVLKDKNLKVDYVAASVDAFTKDAGKLGIPFKMQHSFNQVVEGLRYESSFPNIVSRAPSPAVLEITGKNYRSAVSKKLDGGAAKLFDFDDTFAASGSYGCFQLHDQRRKKTIFAYNNFRGGNGCDIGIGNNPAVGPKSNPDWTFSKSGNKYISAELYISVE